MSAERNPPAGFTYFAETTSIDGFAFINPSRHRAMRSFWSIVIAVTLALTARDVTHATEDYLAEHTATQITEKRNSTIRLPTPTICMRGSASLIHKMLSINRVNPDTSLVSGTLAYLDTYPDINVWINNITELQAKDVSSGGRGAPQSMRALALISALFHSISYIELKQLNSIVRNETLASDHWTWGNPLRKAGAFSNNDSQFTAALRSMRNYLVKRNVDLVKLRHNVALTWANVWELRFSFPSNSDKQVAYTLLSKYDPIITWFGAVPFGDVDTFAVCYRISTTESAVLFEERLAASWMIVQHTPDQPVVNWFDTLTSPASYMEFEDIILSNARTVNSGKSFKDVTTWTFRMPHPFNRKPWAQAYYRDTEVTYVKRHTAANLRRRPCSHSSESNSDCRLKCQADYFVSICGCMPFYLQLVNDKSGVPYCGFRNRTTESGTDVSDLVACARSVSEDANKHLGKCYDNCLEECTRSWFSFATKLMLEEPGAFGVTMASYSYTELEERLEMTVTDFVATIGGIIGVWNGASAIAYLHVMVSIITMCIRKLSARVSGSQQKMCMVGVPARLPVAKEVYES